MNLAESAVSFIKMTIPDGTLISEVLELEDGVYPVGFFHPIITTSTEVKFNLKFEEAGSLIAMHNGGTVKAITIDPSVNAYEPLVPADFAGVKWIQLAVDNGQSGDKEFYLATRGV